MINDLAIVTVEVEIPKLIHGKYCDLSCGFSALNVAGERVCNLSWHNWDNHEYLAPGPDCPRYNRGKQNVIPIR
jgi:hypothetical protein